MTDAPSFFQLSSRFHDGWHFDKLLDDIASTQDWLTQKSRSFLVAAGNGDVSENIARQGIAVLNGSMHFMQEGVPFLFDEAEHPENRHIPFTMKNLFRIQTVFDVWNTLQKVTPQDALPFTMDSFSILQETTGHWHYFTSSLKSRCAFLEEQKLSALPCLFEKAQNILHRENHPLAGIAQKADMTILASFPSFAEEHIGIHQQMSALLAGYLLCTISKLEKESKIDEMLVISPFWDSAFWILRQYPLIDDLMVSEYPRRSDIFIEDIENGNLGGMAGKLQVQETVQQILSTI